MIKSKSILEIKAGERIYSFFCESDSPLGEIHDVLCKMKAFVIEKIVEAEKKQEEAK